MREIKFRAWIDNKVDAPEMISSDIVLSNFGYYLDDSDITLMQYTGLKDKNGVEIYEGDCIEIHAIDFSHKFSETIDDIFKAHALVGNSETRWEVIGNIYENPELLTVNNPQDTK